MLEITSKSPGFIRCGVHHPGTPTLYPDDRFSKEEMARLEACSMLIVRRVAVADPLGEDPQNMTIPELKTFLDIKEVEYPSGALKSDLVSLAEAAKNPGSGE